MINTLLYLAAMIIALIIVNYLDGGDDNDEM